MVSPIRSRVSLDEHFAAPETMLPMELIDGKIELAAAPAINHQRYVGRVYTLIDRLKPNGEVLPSPVDVVMNDSNVFQPDVLWISANNDRCIEQEGRLCGLPDVVIEILSPSTKRMDRTRKFSLCKSAGACELWLSDPLLESVEIWILKDSEFELVGTYRTPQTFASPALNATAITLSDNFPQTA